MARPTTELSSSQRGVPTGTEGHGFSFGGYHPATKPGFVDRAIATANALTALVAAREASRRRQPNPKPTVR